jgi:S1-C subfamily serine protease
MRQSIRIAVLIFPILFAAGGLSAEDANNLEKSVIMIRSVAQEFDYVTPWQQKMMTQGVGSGFIIEGKRILTNAHNVSNNKYIELQKENVAKRYPAKVAFIGHDCDLAILIVDDESFFVDTVALEFAGLPVVNSTVSTYGFPVGGRHISVTEGVVSRIQMDTYAHSGADSHLVIQTDAAINPGNSGGPVMQNGKVVGVAFQGLRQAENIGYMIPTTVTGHFLKDIEDGRYDGFGSLGVMLYPGLHSVSYKDYLQVPADKSGIVVIDTLMHSSVETILKTGDVLTQIDEYDIDNDGRVRIHGLMLDLMEVVETKQIGETARMVFYRQGERMEATAAVALNKPILEYARQYDKPPRYVCFAGLVFVPATRNYLETWGPQWLGDVPFFLRYLFHNSMQINTDRQRKEYIVLSEIMPDQINSFAGDFKSQVLESINGRSVWGLEDVRSAFAEDSNDFYLVKFTGIDRPLVLNTATARQRHKFIMEKYGIPEESRLEVQQ